MVANPPFGLDEWGYEVAIADRFGRFPFGLPPKSRGDLAFVQHMVASLNSTGVVGVVMAHGVLFRGAGEGKIREGMLKADMFDAVIGLPQNLFYGTGIPAAILVLRREKPPERRGHVLFIDASNDFASGTNQNALRDRDVERIASTYRKNTEVEQYSRRVSLAEIEENGFNLNLSRYIDTTVAEDEIDLTTAVANLRNAENAQKAAATSMWDLLRELGFDE